jgi:hypothetical protein
VRSLVGHVRAPTLVLHRKKDRVIPHAEARRLAAALPHAELVSLEGTAHMPWDGDGDALASAIEAFCAATVGDAPDPARTAYPSDAQRGDTAAELLRDGEIWTTRFAGRVARLATAKGITDLATLLGRRGEEVHVLSLLGAPDPTSGGDPALDRAALASYRRGWPTSTPSSRTPTTRAASASSRSEKRCSVAWPPTPGSVGAPDGSTIPSSAPERP